MVDFRSPSHVNAQNSGGTCIREDDCYFAKAIVQNAVLKVKYAGMRHYCRAGDASKCARFQAMLIGGRAADNLLPDGTIDVSLSGRSQRVLVVDDIPVFRKLMEGIVASSVRGVDVISVGNGREALQLIATDHIDLVVTDYNMPEMSGGDLLKLLRGPSVVRHVPVLVFSTETNPALREEALSHKRVRWVPKSPDRREFALAINELLIQGLE